MRSSCSRRLALAALLAVVAWVGSAALAPLPARLGEQPSPVLAWRDGTTAHVGLAPDERWRVAVDLDRLDPAYPTALLALEDARFWWHPGVDPLAVLRAAWTNLSSGRVVSGASTLTMQLVRVLEPRPRTVSAKLIEVHRALSLELWLSKRQILEAYLSFAPYGRNVEGVESASWTYFGHSPEALSPDEIAVLLAVPQAPTSRYPTPGHAEVLRAARDEVASRLLAANALRLDEASPEQVLDAVRRSAVPTHLRPPPRDVPHVAAWWVSQRAQAREVSSLDRGLQAVSEAVLERYVERRRLQGIHDATILVADARDGSLRAAIGGTDFWSGRRGAQIAAFDVPRSPGSTLKPWLYALTIDAGLALPEHLVPDIPLRYGAYSPTNFDDTFAGVVRLEDALSRSLNVPFIPLLAEIGIEPFLGSLAQAGVSSLDNTPGHYGLSAIVGGLELTPLELLGLYTTLARDGRYVPLTWRPREEQREGVPLLSEGGSWLTRRALRLRDRPDFPARKDVARLPREIAWKTGTSFGHRDAWAVGFNDQVVALVWMGNLDQTPSKHLVGSEASAEILFDLLEAIAPRRADSPDDPPPADLVEIEVCALSGHLPGPACARTERVFARQAGVPPETCPFHVRVEVDLLTGLAVSASCRGDRQTEERSFLQWPASVRRWLNDRRFQSPERPAWAPGCAPTDRGTAPRILHPPEGHVVLLLPTRSPSDQEIPLEADTDQIDGDLSWFLDGTFLGTLPVKERLWWTPVPGSHELVVVDAVGRSSHRSFEVRSGLARLTPSGRP
jgi:penicillin-binding protein 1C